MAGTTTSQTGAPGMPIPGLGGSIKDFFGTLFTGGFGNPFGGGGSSSTPMSGTGGDVSALDLGRGEDFSNNGGMNPNDHSFISDNMALARMGRPEAWATDPSRFVRNTNMGGSNTYNIGNAVQNGAPRTSLSIPGTGGNMPSAAPVGSYAAAFPANGTNPRTSSGITIPGLPAGIIGGGSAVMDKNTIKSLDKIYGKGMGKVVAQFMAGGAGYNPAVAQALVNQAQPAIARGEAKILDAFGDSGLRFSSTAALGLGDFESQAFAEVDSALMQEYDRSVDRYMSILTHTASDAKDSKAGQAGLWQNIMNIASQIAFGN